MEDKALAIGCGFLILILAGFKSVSPLGVEPFFDVVQVLAWIGLPVAIFRIFRTRAKSGEQLTGDTPKASKPHHGAHITDEELLWAEALEDFEGPSRRPGLWAQAFAESGGNESAAKARYLQTRFEEIRSRRERIAQPLGSIKH